MLATTSVTEGTSAIISSIAGVFQGRELTRKQRRLPSGVTPADRLLQGGIPRGRISEITGPKSSGKTALAAAFVITASAGGEAVAIIDWSNAFDPHSLIGTRADFSRILWIHPPPALRSRPAYPGRSVSILKNCLNAAELVLEAGGFGLLVIDMGGHTAPFAPAVAMRLARMAERGGTAVIVLAGHPLCGTFAVLGLTLGAARSVFERSPFGVRSLPRLRATDSFAPELVAGAQSVLFQGLEINAELTRNKLGPSNANTRWYALMADDSPPAPQPVPQPARSAAAPRETPWRAKLLRQSRKIG